MLLAIPALRAVRAGGDTITLAAQPRIGALLVALGEADETINVDTLGLEALFADVALAPDATVARRLREATRVICWFGARDALFTERLRALARDAVIGPPASTAIAVWRHLLHTAVRGERRRADDGPDGAEGSAAQPPALGWCEPVVVNPKIREQGRAALRAIGWDGLSRVVVVHPGAGGIAKRWPVDAFTDLIAEIDATVVVHQGPADVDAVEALVARTRRRVLRLVDPPLPVLAGVLAEAAAYLGNDSGVSHLAGTVGAPAVVLFTPATLRWIPWSPTARCITVRTGTVVPAERDAVRAALAALT